MTQELKDYLEQEGISKDDIINAEIEQEHKEAKERNEKYQKDAEMLREEILSTCDKRKTYFQEIADGKHSGKKIFEHKFEITFAEIVDYDKNKLVYEATEEDKKTNIQYLKKCCSSKTDKDFFQFVSEIQKNERFFIEELCSRSREIKNQKSNNDVAIKAVNMATGEIKDIFDAPPEIINSVQEILQNVTKKTENKQG